MSDLLVPLRRCSISCGATLARWLLLPRLRIGQRSRAQTKKIAAVPLPGLPTGLFREYGNRLARF